MKRVDRRRSPDVEAVGLAALTFLGSDADALSRFLIASGLDPATLRNASREPGFLRGVLWFLLGEEDLLKRFAADQNQEPEAIGRLLMAIVG